MALKMVCVDFPARAASSFPNLAGFGGQKGAFRDVVSGYPPSLGMIGGHVAWCAAGATAQVPLTEEPVRHGAATSPGSRAGCSESPAGAGLGPSRDLAEMWVLSHAPAPCATWELLRKTRWCFLMLPEIHSKHFHVVILKADLTFPESQTGSLSTSLGFADCPQVPDRGTAVR